MDLEKLKRAGFKKTRYPGQEDVFWKKTLKAQDMPCFAHLVGEVCDEDSDVWVEVVPGDAVQMGITDSDYYEEPVDADSDEGRRRLRAAGVEA